MKLGQLHEELKGTAANIDTKSLKFSDKELLDLGFVKRFNGAFGYFDGNDSKIEGSEPFIEVRHGYIDRIHDSRQYVSQILSAIKADAGGVRIGNKYYLIAINKKTKKYEPYDDAKHNSYRIKNDDESINNFYETYEVITISIDGRDILKKMMTMKLAESHAINTTRIESSNGPAKYWRQCNDARCDADGEAAWQNMMKKRVKISMSSFLQAVDISTFMHDDEDDDRSYQVRLKEYIADDPTSGFYKSVWEDRPAYFIQTKGFEFIFK